MRKAGYGQMWKSTLNAQAKEERGIWQKKNEAWEKNCNRIRTQKAENDGNC